MVISKMMAVAERMARHDINGIPNKTAKEHEWAEGLGPGGFGAWEAKEASFHAKTRCWLPHHAKDEVR